METADSFQHQETYISVHEIGCKSSPASEFLIQSDAEFLLGVFGTHAMCCSNPSIHHISSYSSPG